MLANADPYSGTFPINPFAREVAAVCDKHAVPHGTPGKLADFLRALDRNKHLAMDFWSLVVRFSEDEKAGSVDPDWLLAVIVEGVTGWNVAKLVAADTPDIPHVGELASMLAGEDLSPPPPENDVPPAPTPLLTHDEVRRLVLQPEEPPATSDVIPSLRPISGDQLGSLSMAGYADTTSGTTLPYAAILALIVLVPAIAGLLLLNHRDPTAPKHLGASLRLRSASALSSLRPHSATQPASSTIPAAPHSTASPFAIPAPGIPVEDPAAVPPSASAPPASAQALAPRKASAPGNPPTVAGADVASLTAVPEQTMRAQLISSRVPIYPFTAELPGPVVIRAVITANGTVRPVEVISGDQELRQAALDAVSTWHYRPYMVDGMPADVSTTITVEPPTDRP